MEKEEIIKLLRKGNASVYEISEKFNVSPESVRAIKAHLTMGTYDNMEETEQITDAVETKFGLERDMQMALRHNIEQLEKGLTIIDGGKETITPAGRIDILARDLEGLNVIIELKAGIAKPESLTQILAYMGTYSEVTRGILIASDFHEKVIFAARTNKFLKLMKYKFHFSFQETLKNNNK